MHFVLIKGTLSLQRLPRSRRDKCKQGFRNVALRFSESLFSFGIRYFQLGHLKSPMVNSTETYKT